MLIPPTDTTMAPYGDVTLMSIRAPGGVHLGFYARR